jgi:hypothetical protein
MNVPAALKPLPQSAPKGGANINIILELLHRTENVNGSIAECGVYRGATLLAVGLYLKHAGSEKLLYGFDSFAGFDCAVRVDQQMAGEHTPFMRVGAFADTSDLRLSRRLNYFGLQSRVHLRKGYFKDTFDPHWAQQFSFVHLDCDIYESYKICLEYFFPRMEKNGIVLFDEYNDPAWPGCTKAIDEFLADKPEKLEKIARNNYERYFITKT